MLLHGHVPLVEHNPTEGKNNVIGTLITAQVAIEKGVSDFVLISTDKAVRPPVLWAPVNVGRALSASTLRLAKSADYR